MLFFLTYRQRIRNGRRSHRERPYLFGEGAERIEAQERREASKGRRNLFSS